MCLLAGGHEPVLCQVCVPPADVKPVQCWTSEAVYLQAGDRASPLGLQVRGLDNHRSQKHISICTMPLAFPGFTIHHSFTLSCIHYSVDAHGGQEESLTSPTQLQEGACGPGLDTAPCIPMRLDARLCSIGAIRTKPGCLWNLLESGSLFLPDT